MGRRQALAVCGGDFVRSRVEEKDIMWLSERLPVRYGVWALPRAPKMQQLFGRQGFYNGWTLRYENNRIEIPSSIRLGSGFARASRTRQSNRACTVNSNVSFRCGSLAVQWKGFLNSNVVAVSSSRKREVQVSRWDIDGFSFITGERKFWSLRVKTVSDY